jgi:hypothetical protein
MLKYVTPSILGPKLVEFDVEKDVQVTLVATSWPSDVASDINDPPREVASVKMDPAVQPS